MLFREQGEFHVLQAQFSFAELARDFLIRFRLYSSYFCLTRANTPKSSSDGTSASLCRLCLRLHALQLHRQNCFWILRSFWRRFLLCYTGVLICRPQKPRFPLSSKGRSYPHISFSMFCLNSTVIITKKRIKNCG